MHALEPRVVDAVWAAVKSQLPEREPDRHPLGCHRRRLCDRGVFESVLFRLVVGCSWSTAALLGNGSATTLRTRYNEWNRDGVFDRAVGEALAGYDRIIGLDPSDVSVDASLHKAPSGGPGTGPNPCDRLNPAGNGRSRATGAASRWGGPPQPPTGPTPLCWNRPWTRWRRGACSRRSTPCTSTAAMTAQPCGGCAPTRESPKSTALAGGRRNDPPGPLSGPRWASAGSSSAPTRGCRTSGSCDATPTAPPVNASASSPWPSPSSSP